MAAGPHRSFEGFEIGPSLGIQQTGEPRHPVGPLWAQVHTATAGAIGFGETAIGIEIVGDPVAQPGDHGGVELGRMPHQRALRVGHVDGGDAGGQRVDRGAYGADMVLADRAGGHRLGQHRELGFQWRARQRTSRP